MRNLAGLARSVELKPNGEKARRLLEPPGLLRQC